jgi:hypothetical protein
MSYAELFTKVSALLDLNIWSFRIEVGTWQHRRDSSPETEWEIYITSRGEGGGGDCHQFTGPSAEQVFGQLIDWCADPQTLAETSAAVGTAEVDA